MKFDITVIQTLEGHVSIEADSLAKAIAIADQRYNVEGRELPDMEDTADLRFDGQPAVCKHYRAIGGCMYNNDPEDEGECVYEDGIPFGKPFCAHHE